MKLVLIFETFIATHLVYGFLEDFDGVDQTEIDVFEAYLREKGDLDKIHIETVGDDIYETVCNVSKLFSACYRVKIYERIK